MSEKKKARPQVIVTPAGIAVYPHLTEPDSRFEGQEPKYKIKLRLDPNNSDHAKFIADIEQKREAALPAMKAEYPKFAARMKLEYDTVKEEFDKEGEATGFVVIEFKCKASIKSKTDPNKTTPIKPKLFDSKNRALPEGTKIGGGSIVKVAFTPIPFAFSNTKVGLSLRLEAVQVIELVEYSGGRSPFEEEEGGYEAEETPFDAGGADSKNGGSASSAAAAADADEDF